MGLMIEAIINETPTFMKNNIKFRVIGDISKLPDNLKTKIYGAEELTSKNSGLTLIIFLSYSGKWDILQANQKVAQFVLNNPNTNTDEQTLNDLFESYLSTNGVPDPDLLIRTSGEQRISNFMLWQAAYTELYFTEILWPDFRKTNFQQALDEFAQRERRFGKTGEQVNIL
jgi:undecaprenyl diphosphate synthase